MIQRANMASSCHTAKFQPPLSRPVRAETVFMRITGIRTEEGAKVEMLRRRDKFEEVMEALSEAGASERVPTYTTKVFTLAQRRAPVSLPDALAAYSRKDSEQDGQVTVCAMDLEDEAKAHDLYRKTMVEIAAAQDLACALRLKHGWGA